MSSFRVSIIAIYAIHWYSFDGDNVYRSATMVYTNIHFFRKMKNAFLNEWGLKQRRYGWFARN